MKIYPILNNLGKGKYAFIFILNERAVYKTLIFTPIDCLNRIFLLTLPRLNGDFTQMSSNKLNE